MSAQGIVAFDLDGTLLRGPTVCELLAAPLGRLPEMRRFEGFSSEREIAEARREMARWYRDVPVSRLCAALEGASWAPGAREAVRRLQEAGVEVLIASITWRFAVEWFAERLGVAHVLGTGLEADGDVRHVWPRDKGTWLRDMTGGLGVSPARVAAVGDAASDGELLAAASLRYFVGSASPPALPDLRLAPAGDLEQIALEVLESWAA